MATGEALISQLLVDDPDMRDLVEEFVATLQTRVDDIRAALGQSDWDRLQTLAHQLKGAGGSYGYPDLSSVAASLETLFKRQAVDGADGMLAELERLTAAARLGLA